MKKCSVLPNIGAARGISGELARGLGGKGLEVADEVGLIGIAKLVDQIQRRISRIGQQTVTHGFKADAFGRPSSVTVQRPGDPSPGLLAFQWYEGFDGVNAHDGRIVAVETYTDTDPNAEAHVTRTFFDELGRKRYARVELGGDYNETLVVDKPEEVAQAILDWMR